MDDPEIKTLNIEPADCGTSRSLGSLGITTVLVFVAFALCAACSLMVRSFTSRSHGVTTERIAHRPRFLYRDRVVIVDGFYEGRLATIYDFDDRNGSYVVHIPTKHESHYETLPETSLKRFTESKE